MFVSKWTLVRRKNGTFIVSWKWKKTAADTTHWENFDDGCSDQQTLELAVRVLNEMNSGFTFDVGQGGSYHILNEATQKLVAWHGWHFAKDAPQFELCCHSNN
ncbi:hypothetical protein OAM67_01085 [bacterium]|nr:hypothetical protein [bacterium]